MVQSHFSLSWESYKSSICSGFSSLQQNGEFVDMTLAADGHLVKVHQVLLALSSPYLKELITSAPCQHPILFLNNISHKTLCLLLEYIYTGEVIIPAENMASFAEAARALHIKGLESIHLGDNVPSKPTMTISPVDDSETCYLRGTKRVTVPTVDGNGQISLPVSARKIMIKQDMDNPVTTIRQIKNDSKDFTSSYAEMMDDSGTQDSDDGFPLEEPTNIDVNEMSFNMNKPPSNIQYTVSIRGSLQVILNRYIYNLHSISHRTGVRRWRCVEYRNKKCMAFLVTKGNIVLNRGNLHNHGFHDKKIVAKIEKKSIYSAIDEVQGYKEKEDKTSDNDMTMESETLMSFDEYSKTKDS